MSHARILWMLTALVVIIVGILIASRTANAPVSPSVSIPANEPASFSFEIRDTAAQREQGLSGRTDVPGNYGMLFVFPEKGIQGFWMKDMHVSIDIIWLSEDGTILGIEDSVSPDTYPTVFSSPEPVRYVLETRAGEARAKGWSIGTRIELPD